MVATASEAMPELSRVKGHFHLQIHRVMAIQVQK